jgi:predicted ribosome quality control (RQC) complex YloA/Tae2 family protein
MKVEINPRKTVQQNAAEHYERAKKLRAKIPGLEKAIDETQRQIGKEKKRLHEEAVPKKRVQRQHEWYEKFHWFFSSGGRLAIGGRDAKSNETVVKRHMESKDLFFHADVHGASAVVLRNGQDAGPQELKETAQFAACFSKAWSSGTEACDVYAVEPEQVKTAAKSGEYLAKGSFVILGKRKWFKKAPLRMFVTLTDGKVTIQPEFALKDKQAKHVVIKPGRGSKGDAAKTLLKMLKHMFPKADIAVDDLLQVLPNGGSTMVKK